MYEQIPDFDKDDENETESGVNMQYILTDQQNLQDELMKLEKERNRINQKLEELNTTRKIKINDLRKELDLHQESVKTTDLDDEERQKSYNEIKHIMGTFSEMKDEGIVEINVSDSNRIKINNTKQDDTNSNEDLLDVVQMDED